MNLKDYLINSDLEPQDIYGIFLELDKSLEALHASYVIDKLDASKISVDENGFYFNKDYIYLSNDSYLKRDNIKRLAKMTLGAYLTSHNRFEDYSEVDDEYFKIYFNDINNFIYKDLNEDSYYYDLFINNRDNLYHASFIRYMVSEGENAYSTSFRKTKVKVKEGFNSEVNLQFDYSPSSKINAFISFFFYPILFLISIICFYAISLVLQIL